jgi:hypothetical protein
MIILEIFYKYMIFRIIIMTQFINTNEYSREGIVRFFLCIESNLKKFIRVKHQNNLVLKII